MISKINKIKRSSYIAMLMTVVLSLGLTVSSAIAGEVPAIKITQEDNTGTNPAGFANKFTPYYTYTELENGLEVQQLMLSGSIAFNKDVSMTLSSRLSGTRFKKGLRSRS